MLNTGLLGSRSNRDTSTALRGMNSPGILGETAIALHPLLSNLPLSPLILCKTQEIDQKLFEVLIKLSVIIITIDFQRAALPARLEGRLLEF
jgi:hypothetical protein